MKYFKAENGIVTQVICNPREEFTKTEDNVVCGMLWDGEAFTTPEPTPKTVQSQIDDLENSVTKRNYREAVMGNSYSINKITKVDAEIVILRAKL